MKKPKKLSWRKTRKTKKSDIPKLTYIFPAFLLPKEKIIFQTHPHWLLFAAPEAALGFLEIFFIRYLPRLFPEEIPFIGWYLFLIVAGFSFAMVIIFLDWIFTTYYLTNFRLIKERGIIGQKIMSIPLDKVQDVTARFGILGRIFGFGDIEIESAGTYGKIVFGFLPSPRKVQEKIELAICDFYKPHSSE